jgi:hypothetical protein
MCNAHNHPPDCTCGWGGEGHLGGGRSDELQPWEKHDFTKPARCPKCGAGVFFIRHNGGSVWVDELGWPWPLHGCFEPPVGPLLVFGSWSSKMARLKNSKLGIIDRAKKSFPDQKTTIEIQMANSRRLSVVARIPLHPPALEGALVVVALDEHLLLHNKLGEIPFFNPVDLGTRPIVIFHPNSVKRGVFRQMDTCSACGERYLPEDREDHLANNCFPPINNMGEPIKRPPTQPSAGEKWRLMRTSSLTPAERKALGLFAKGRRLPRKK